MLLSPTAAVLGVANHHNQRLPHQNCSALLPPDTISQISNTKLTSHFTSNQQSSSQFPDSGHFTHGSHSLSLDSHNPGSFRPTVLYSLDDHPITTQPSVEFTTSYFNSGPQRLQQHNHRFTNTSKLVRTIPIPDNVYITSKEGDAVFCTTSNVPMPRANQITSSAQAQQAGHVDAVNQVLINAGDKRGAPTLTGITQIHSDGLSNSESGLQSPRLPPKLKDSERMLHVQRWVNNLPWGEINITSAASSSGSVGVGCGESSSSSTSGVGGSCSENTAPGPSASSGQGSSGCCSLMCPGICSAGGLLLGGLPAHLEPPEGTEGERTPPPGRLYMSRLPLGPEELAVFDRRYKPSQHHHHHHPQQQNIQNNINSGHQPQQQAQQSTGLHANVVVRATGPNASVSAAPSSQPCPGFPPYPPPHPQTYAQACCYGDHYQHAHAGADYQCHQSRQPATPAAAAQAEDQVYINGTGVGKADGAGGSCSANRLFTDWETRLVVQLFAEFFTPRNSAAAAEAAKVTSLGGGIGGGGYAEPTSRQIISGSPGHKALAASARNPHPQPQLPSLAEVRLRLATSRLKETRSAVSVRSKIKRLLATGAWAEFK